MQSQQFPQHLSEKRSHGKHEEKRHEEVDRNKAKERDETEKGKGGN
jgi:hypothetical protein